MKTNLRDLMVKNYSILYVDDEDQLRFLVQNQLSQEGFNVDTADDGDTALDMMKQKSYDVVLLDIRMPRLNGLEVLKEMKKRKTNARAIMLTGVDDLAVALEAVKSGAIDYLTKPYELDNLMRSIMRVIG
ncbi:MAG: response regulator [Ignavibacteriales bacterium]|nr:response regulator [Ignavibacteriales bacterium]